MKKLLASALSIITLAISIGALAPQPAVAAVPVFQACSGNGGTAICQATSDKLFGPGGIWNRVLNTLIFVTGSISVLMVIIGGLRYTLSNGDQGSITSAKNTILYALVGLVLSLMGYAIVNFILSRI